MTFWRDSLLRDRVQGVQWVGSAVLVEVFLVKWNIRGNWCAINAWPPLSEFGEHDG